LLRANRESITIFVMLSASTLTEKSRCIIGLMSGTSCDGIDTALALVSGTGSTLRATLLDFLCVPYENETRAKLLRASEMNAGELALLDFELGKLFGDAASQLIARQVGSTPSLKINVIASHGHTVCHLPQQNATLQIGESAMIANATGIMTISDFRVADVAAGGQGAPLIPYVDWCLLRSESVHRIIQNIGGIANCTVLPANCELENVRAWDTGPGNMIMDECARVLTDGTLQFDEDGKLAAQGRTDENWLRDLMRHEYFFRAPPVSCGREEFGKVFAQQFLKEGARRGLSTPDLIATATALTAESIAHAYRTYAAPLLPDGDLEIILGGGGAFNPTLRQMLQARVASGRVLTHEEIGAASDAKEALAFAVLAHETLNGVPSNVPSATGARQSVVLGKMTFGIHESNA
jgi:anhydro-N-acetylmuramic acid kinase